MLGDTTSTNAVALEAAQSGTPDGTVVVADRQTAGRGRLARRWESPGGHNLYCSIVIRHIPASERLGWLPLIAATATAAAVRKLTGLRLSLKWPNDVMVGAKKVGGILCESHEIGTANGCVVIGIGVNVNWPEHEMPAEIRAVATSLAAHMRAPVDRVRLLTTLLLELETRVDQWRTGDLTTLAEEYRTHCGTIGQPVRIELGAGAVIEGTVIAIEPDGSLRVSTRNGLTPRDHIVRSGDIVHLRPQQAG